MQSSSNVVVLKAKQNLTNGTRVKFSRNKKIRENDQPNKILELIEHKILIFFL